MKILIIIYFLFRIFIFVFPKCFFSEIFLSFTPYIIVFDILLIFIFIVYYLKFSANIKSIFLQKNIKLTKKKVSFFIFSIILLIQIFISIDGIKKITSIYSQINITTDTLQDNFSGLTILYANIHKDNLTYTGLVNPIKKYNPDVVAFVEYEKGHQNLLRDFWKKNYPYSIINSKYGAIAGNVIFSKYPLTDLSSTVNKIPRRFGYVFIKKNQKNYFFYLVHTSSPRYYKHYKARNKQLQYFADVIKSEKETNGHNQTVVLGDFNISPRSPFYSNFTDNIGHKYINITTAIPLVMTWGLLKTPFPKVHIDHIFLSKPEECKIIKKIDISGITHNGYKGSDHNGFIFQIK